jgi:hypothetical protein
MPASTVSEPPAASATVLMGLRERDSDQDTTAPRLKRMK